MRADRDRFRLFATAAVYVPTDHEADRGIATRLRLLDQLAADKRRLVAAHLPFPGTGFVQRKDGFYRFVPA
jgi:hypothetical protein